MKKTLISTVLWLSNDLFYLNNDIQWRTQGGCTGCTCIPPSPPCIPPPSMCIPPLPSLAGYEKRWGSGHWATRKKCKFVYLRLDNFLLRIIIYKKQKGFGEHIIQSVFETLRCCWETNNSRQPALSQTKCSEGCCISVNRWESAIACWHAYKSELG